MNVRPDEIQFAYAILNRLYKYAQGAGPVAPQLPPLWFPPPPMGPQIGPNNVPHSPPQFGAGAQNNPGVNPTMNPDNTLQLRALSQQLRDYYSPLGPARAYQNAARIMRGRRQQLQQPRATAPRQPQATPAPARQNQNAPQEIVEAQMPEPTPPQGE